MGAVSRWKRRIRKTKRNASKLKGWFTNDPMASTKGKRTQRPARGAWTRERLSKAGGYPDPAWYTEESGRLVYGPVRDGKGWIWTDSQGRTVYTKQDKIKEHRAETGIPVRKTAQSKPGKVCGKRTADGTPCRFRGNCPHHKNKLR